MYSNVQSDSLFSWVRLPGLSMGDEQGRQPIGIVLTVLGVVVLDFCADATEGPIRAYLLDVADTEEQDMALNIHAASAGRMSTREASILYLFILLHCSKSSANIHFDNLQGSCWLLSNRSNKHIFSQINESCFVFLFFLEICQIYLLDISLARLLQSESQG